MKQKLFSLFLVVIVMIVGTSSVLAKELIIYHNSDNYTAASSDNNTFSTYSWDDGFNLQLTGNIGKDYSAGNGDITISGVSYKTIKNSNGAANTFYAPSGSSITKVVFYVTSNADESGYLNSFNGESCSDEVTSHKDYSNPTVISKTISDGASEVSFTFGTRQVCFVAVVTYNNTETQSQTTDETSSITFGLTRPLTAPAEEGVNGTMGANVWNTANGLITLSEIMGSEVSIDGGNRSYVIDGVTYTATQSYRKNISRSAFDEAQYAGYTFTVPDGKKLDLTSVSARLSDASNCTWTWKISVQNSDSDNPATQIWGSSNKSTASNSTTNVSISDAAFVNALSGLKSGTYQAKIYFYQGGSSKCNTIDLTFTGNLLDADPEVAEVVIPETANAILNESNTIKATVNAYPAVTAYQWYSCDVNGENATAVEGATTSTLTFTPSAEGTIYYYLAATNEAGTANSNVCAVTVMAEAEFADFSAILNNQSGSLLTSAEQVQGTSVNFGIATDEDGNTVRVAADSPLAFATVSGAYHSDHGMTGLSVTTKVSGNVKISVGECTYSGNVITVKNSDNQTVASTTPVQACWKNDNSNVAVLYYEGDATTLTISGMAYCPYIAVEAVETVPALYTINYYNGSELVKTTQVYEGTTLGSLPADQTAPEGQYFIGWYTATDGTGTPATVGTIPTQDVDYYANFVTLTQSNGYVVVDNSGTDRKNGENLLGALAYANANSSANNPVKIFLPNGTYDLGDAAETTKLTASYISLIGESLEGTIIKNTPVQEGLGTATLLYNKGEYNYLQDITLHNNYPFGNSTGRAASLKDEGNYTICKNVWLYSHQDTYYSHKSGGYFYFNGGKISGCVDYMCGQSRVYYDGVTLSNDDRSTYMTANSELYVFNNCIVENNGSNTYYFGRSWGSVNGGPHCIFINTTLKDNGSHLANTRWVEAAMNNLYVTAGEYGTKNADGTDITPSSNIVNFTHSSGNVSLETILTAEQAATYTMAYTLGDWAATAETDATQAEVSNVVLNGNTLTWEGSSDAYLIEKNGEFVALTSETSYAVEDGETYTVRAANGRGGFGEAVENTAAAPLILTTSQNMAGYRTFYDAENSYVADNNTIVYVAQLKRETEVVLSRLSDNVVPANTPVILKTTGLKENGTTDAYYQITLTPSDETAYYLGVNLLAVTTEGQDLSAGAYRLGWDAEDGVAFRLWNLSSAPAGIVYLNVSSSLGAKFSIIFDDEEEVDPTAVNAVTEAGETMADGAAYNAAGQRVGKAYKGLVIRNGKKYNNK
ncbi:MAG: hypothetical protein IJ199_07415 [Prevotella sp.]|nr:hypothetical protein [Prevotella sp.]